MLLINDKVIFIKHHLKISMNFMLTYFSSIKKKQTPVHLVSFVGEKKYLSFPRCKKSYFHYVRDERLRLFNDDFR